jgi:hypothetical protein
VTCSNAAAAVGTDRPSDADVRALCRNARDARSPNGPKGAYAYVALNSDLTGTTAVTRVRVYGDSTTGTVNVYLAGPSGAVASADVALVEDAILENATPLCITPVVASCTAVAVPVTYTLWVYTSVNKTAAEIAEEVEEALEAMFAARPIGGDIVPPATTGALYKSMVESTIRSLYPDDAFRVSVSAPASDTALTNGQVATLGAVTAAINLVEAP